VVLHKGRVLLVRISYAHRMWTIPGGRVGKRESWEDAAIREVKEETDIDVLDLRKFDEYYTDKEYKRDTVHCFYARTHNDSIKIDPIEITEAGWFFPGKLPNGRMPSVDRIIKNYQNNSNEKS